MKVLVTGASRGLGSAIALKLAEMGFDLALHYFRQRQLVEEVAHKCGGVHVDLIQGDFSTRESTLDFIRRYTSQHTDTYGLINNAGLYPQDLWQQLDETHYHTLFQVNLHTPFMLIHHLKPRRIVNIGQAGLHSGKAAPYLASKRALYHMTHSMAKEFASHSITVNMVSPGYLENSVDLPSLERLPMQRAATLQEAAAVVGFLFSQAADYITGQNIEVAGGVGL